MKPHTKVRIFIAAVAVALSFGAQAASPKLGETQMCLDTQNIRDTQVVDDQTIVVRLSPGEEYRRLDMNKNCNLRAGNGFAYSTSLPKLCKQDVLKLIDSSQTCSIDQIVTIDKAEAKALEQHKK